MLCCRLCRFGAMRSVQVQALVLKFCALLTWYGSSLADSSLRSGFQVQAATDLHQPDGKLLESMHCFNRSTGVWLNSADWKSSADFLVGLLLVFYSLVLGVLIRHCASVSLSTFMVCIMWCRQPAPASGTCRMQLLQKAHCSHLLAKLPARIWILHLLCHPSVRYESGCTFQTRPTRQEQYRSMLTAVPQTVCMTCLPRAVAVAPWTCM